MFVPIAAAAFLILTNFDEWNWVKQFTDFSFWTGNSSIYCLRDQEGPWIYPPIQTYLYLHVLLPVHI